MRQGYMAASFDIQRDATQADCVVECCFGWLDSCNIAPGSYVQVWLHAPIGDDLVEPCPKALLKVQKVSEGFRR